MNWTSSLSAMLFFTFAATGSVAIAAGNYAAPNICDRDCWEARPPAGTASQMSDLNRAVIHHTAYANEYYTESLEESAANVRGIQNYHMDVNGWSDVGYHFLGDALGYAFEGREGSIDSKPRGAHDGVNDRSFGFSMMGYFHEPHDQVPTEAQRCTIYDLIAWKIPDPYTGLGSSTYSGEETGYLAGHRDVKATACPGDLMYDNFIGTDYEGGEARNEIYARITTGEGLMCGGGPQCCPQAPTLDGVFASGQSSLALSWSDLGEVQYYLVYSSEDGVVFGAGIEVPSGQTTYIDGSITPGVSRFYKVTAVGTLQESDASDVYGARTANASGGDTILIVDGNDRWKTQTESEALNHAFAAQTALDLPDGIPFDTSDNDLVEDGGVPLLDYDAVVWMLGEESTLHETFSSDEQAWVRSYQEAGGNLFVSGAEIGWDLVAQGGAQDRAFFEEVLKAEYIADDGNSYEAFPIGGGDFESVGGLSFQGGPLSVNYPDVIQGGDGATAIMSYAESDPGESQIAGISAPGLVYLAFPFEAIDDASQRASIMSISMTHFGITPGASGPSLHVEDIRLSIKGQSRKRAIAAVSIYDDEGNAVANALVTGHFEGVIDEEASASTRGNGMAIVSSSTISGSTTPLTFCVDVVSSPGLSYDGSANVIVCTSL